MRNYFTATMALLSYLAIPTGVLAGPLLPEPQKCPCRQMDHIDIRSPEFFNQDPSTPRELGSGRAKNHVVATVYLVPASEDRQAMVTPGSLTSHHHLQDTTAKGDLTKRSGIPFVVPTLSEFASIYVCFLVQAPWYGLRYLAERTGDYCLSLLEETVDVRRTDFLVYEIMDSLRDYPELWTARYEAIRPEGLDIDVVATVRGMEGNHPMIIIYDANVAADVLRLLGWRGRFENRENVPGLLQPPRNPGVVGEREE